MNKLLLLILLLFGFGVAQAQQNTSSLINARIKDGSIMLGGSLGGNYQKYEHNNLNTGKKETGDLITARLNTKSGYFFLPDFAVGLNLSFQHTNINVDSTRYGDSKTTYLLAGPFVRYYFNSGIFLEANVNAGVLAIQGGNKSDIKNGIFGIGYAYFLNDRIAIEPLLTFKYETSRIDNADYNIKDKQFGPELNIGIQAYLWAPTRVLPTK